MRDRWKPGPLVFALLAFYLVRSCSYLDNESDSGWGRKGGGGWRRGSGNREEGDDGAGAVRAVVPKGRLGFGVWGDSSPMA
jgi:hypothetical protein